MGHDWQPQNARLADKDSIILCTIRCDRCQTRREFGVRRRDGRRVDVSGAGYDYPDGYQIKGAGQLDEFERGFMRLQAMGSLFGAEFAPQPDGGGDVAPVTPLRRKRTRRAS